MQQIVLLAIELDAMSAVWNLAISMKRFVSHTTSMASKQSSYTGSSS